MALQSSTERVTLERTEAGWGVVERSGYPVDFKRLEELLRALSQARLLEQKTSRPEYFSRLGLVDIEQPDSKAVLLELWSGAEQALVRVLIGDPAESRNGRYVRAASGSETWLIDQSPEPLTDAADWIDRHFLDVDFSRVERVTRTVPGGNGFVAVRETPGRGEPRRSRTAHRQKTALRRGVRWRGAGSTQRGNRGCEAVATE